MDDRHIKEISAAKRALLQELLVRQGKQSCTPHQIVRRQQGGTLPLSFAQERLWLLDQLVPDRPLNNVALLLRLSGPLDVAVLHRSLRETINRHEILRTKFALVEGNPVQVITPPADLSLSSIDLGVYDPELRSSIAFQQAKQIAQQPFQLQGEPLLRLYLFKIEPEHHLLLVTVHHCIFDGWSTAIFLRELTTYYKAYRTGQPVWLPELPVQYADFALWQRERLQGETFANLLTYWREQLAGMPAVLELPTDFPRPSIPNFQGAHCSFELAPRLVARLKALSEQEKVTLFMTLFAAFCVLLHRYSAQEDIVIGLPVSNRPRAEMEDLIGFFINTLVLRVNISGDPSFRNLLTHVRDVVLHAQQHQDLPFEQLVKEVHPGRDLIYRPLIQSLFVWQHASQEEFQAADLSIRPLELDLPIARFDLTFSLIATEQGIRGKVEYSSEIFMKATIGQLITHWQTLLESLATHPDRPVSEAALLTHPEQMHLLFYCNATKRSIPHTSFIELFHYQVSCAPDAIAVITEQEQLSYHEVNRQANQLAQALQAYGVVPEVRVALCVERSIEALIGLLGIFKAGGVYVPLDPAYPPERLRFLLEDTQASVLITQPHLLDRISQTDLVVLSLDRNQPHFVDEQESEPAAQFEPAHLAYIIYTSGSTGYPKGVMVQQEAFVNHIIAFAEQCGLTSQDRILHFHSLSFDASLEEICAALACGAAVAIHPTPLHLSPEHLLSLCERLGVTVLMMPPAYWKQVMNVFYTSRRLVPSTIRLGVTGGEHLAVKTLQYWMQLTGQQASFINLGGATEATIASLYYRVREGDPLLQQAGNCPSGQPFINTQVYVLDKHMQVVPVGMRGELYIGGLGLARGYVRRPDLTAERFLPDPFSSQPGARLYYTGDIVRRRKDGSIEYCGRVDEQVKVRGFRIEPGEVESVLGQHPQVNTCVVTARSDAADSYLAAYIVKEKGESINSSEIRHYLAARLPNYLIPTSIVFLSELPMTAAGKVDRRALPNPRTVADRAHGFVQPASGVERAIAAVWQEILQREHVGRDDNFFELGGHSLLVLRMQNRLQEILKQEISIIDLFRYPTIALLAEALTHKQEGQVSYQESIIRAQMRSNMFHQQRRHRKDQHKEGRQ